ncbi:MAG: FHA domain-containing protein [Gaiellaceae bacterium]
MSVEPILLALQAAFLILLYLFIWRVIRSASRDLRAAPPQESFVMAPAQAARARGEAPPPPARLVVTRSKALKLGQAFEAGPVPATIGRSGDNRIALAGDDFASGHHARVESARDGVWVIDLGSTNGTLVNGERIDGRHRLREGDVLKIGETELRLER